MWCYMQLLLELLLNWGVVAAVLAAKLKVRQRNRVQPAAALVGRCRFG
eukprot:COSAG02_NODE_1283_length_13471_cov_12.121223_10_plen_48_part_00